MDSYWSSRHRVRAISCDAGPRYCSAMRYSSSFVVMSSSSSSSIMAVLRMSCTDEDSRTSFFFNNFLFRSDILNSTSCLGKLLLMSIFDINFNSSSKNSGSLIRMAY